MSERLRVAILGSTGSIGVQALDVVSRFPDRLEVVALAAGTRGQVVAEQAHAHSVRHVAMADAAAAAAVSASGVNASVGCGADAVAALAELPDVDIVLNALVGAAGLDITLRSLAAGKRLALANKESLVVGGDLVANLVSPGQMIPVDSEHSAIYQCLIGEPARDVARIWLTASGGPFRGRTRAELEDVDAARALAHPTWNMGPKITIDSSTLMNKGLEVIEAHHLFGTSYDDIRVVVHPQSCIHSMVEFADGSVKAHLGATDMRIPIQYAFSEPERWGAPLAPVDFAALGHLDFEEPDLETFGCLALAFEVGRTGGTAPAAMNAANEVAVAAFLEGACGFLDIERVVRDVVESHVVETVESFEQLVGVDAASRAAARIVLGI